VGRKRSRIRTRHSILLKVGPYYYSAKGHELNSYIRMIKCTYISLKQENCVELLLFVFDLGSHFS
jgi:hypothetical protein